MIWTDLARRIANDTAARPDAVERVRARLDARLEPTTALLRESFPEVSPASVQRVRERLVRRPAEPYRWWALPAFGAVAALALFAVTRPEPLRDVSLADDGVVLSDIVTVDPSGTGLAHGAAGSWEIDWQSGRIDVEVVANQGAAVTVVTREARVEVVGTGFAVTRDALGTRVDVAHGRVAVTCLSDGTVQMLEVGADRTCEPTTASGLLARAAALAQADSADHAAILASLDRARALPSDEAVGGEIQFHRVATLMAMGRPDEAATAADEVLALGGHARTADARRVALHLALLRQDCARASILLSEMDAPDDDLTVRTHMCTEGAP